MSTERAPKRNRRASVDDEDDEFAFTQEAPELSQDILPVKETERVKLNGLAAPSKKKAVVDLSRLILFKSLSMEPIDRLKVVHAGAGDTVGAARVSSALTDAAKENLENCFGFTLKRMPQFMEKFLPKKYHDRLYVVNDLADDEAGTQSQAIHTVHAVSTVELGFLMTVLGFIFCKGEAKSNGSRWITDVDLYRLLHGLDESLPEAPSHRARSHHTQATQVAVTGDTPNVDVLLEKLVHADFLFKTKVDQETTAASQTQNEDVFRYCMGPRAAMVVGRKQVIHFCAQVLGEQPDPTMLTDVEQYETEVTGESTQDVSQ